MLLHVDRCSEKRMATAVQDRAQPLSIAPGTGNSGQSGETQPGLEYLDHNLVDQKNWSRITILSHMDRATL